MVDCGYAGVRRARRSALVGVVLAALGGSARAQPLDDTYESQRLQSVLTRESLTIDAEPEGKRVAYVEIVRDPVLVGDDLTLPLLLPRMAPTWPNALHVQTRESVIARELLVHDGERYRTELAEESMRNLRALGIFSLVRIVPVRTSDSERVGVLVYTRDLWSLRLETAVNGAGRTFGLGSQLIERNVLGRNKQLAARFYLDPKAYSLGEEYIDARLLGGELSLDQSFDLFINRDSGQAEGSQATLRLGRPFRTLSQPWSWGSVASYSDAVARTLSSGEVASYLPQSEGGDLCKKYLPDCLRAVWRQRDYSAGLSGSYRRGERYKQTFTLGAGFTDREVAPIAETGLRPGQLEEFEREILPKARRQVYPRALYELWLPTYVVLHDLSTFGQSESVRTGPSLSSEVDLPLRAFGSSTDSVLFYGSMGYVWSDGHGLFEGAAYGNTRLENGLAVDQTLSLVARGATPTWFLGRLVGYTSWTGRRHDTALTPAALGGDSGLRGYPSGYLLVRGGSRLRANFEYRTSPLVIASIHVGAVAFYDAGSVYGALAEARIFQAVGAGLRVLLPQFNLTPFRADLGFPLEGGFSFKVSYGTEQAVPLTAADDAAAASIRH